MKKLILIIAILLFAVQGWSTTYHYVNPNLGTGGNDGSSWANAWRTFAGIPWGTLQSEAASQPVYLYVKKGSTSTAIMEIGGSGSSDTNRITITTDSGDSGANPIISNTSGHGMRFDARSYLTISDMDVYNCAYVGITASSASNIGSGIIIEDNTIRECGTYGTFGGGGAGNGIFFKGNDIIIRRNSIQDQDGATPYYSHGIYTDTGITSIEIYDNEIYGTLQGMGITSKSSADIYRNTIYNNSRHGIAFSQMNSAGNTTSDIYANIVYGNGDSGITCESVTSGTYNFNVYNNSTYQNSQRAGTSSSLAEIMFVPALGTVNIKNNILVADSIHYTLSIQTVPSSLSADYNLHYGDYASPVYYVGERTWSYWTTTLGYDVNPGTMSDPLYVSPSSDMTLQSGSPAIDAGVDLGVSYDDALNPISSWPDSVATLDQDSYGSGWEIGAYAYSGSGLVQLMRGMSIQ